MRSTMRCAAVCVCLMLPACASEMDHFYTLSTLPDGHRSAAATPGMHVLLQVSVPPLVDRAEMVINTSNNTISILDHDRWAEVLSDQVEQTLARDIERRRDDVLVGDRGFDQSATHPVTIKVDIVRMWAQRSGHVNIEAHWRIVDTRAGEDQIGSGIIDTPVDGDSSASIAKAYSVALSTLADQLVSHLHES